MSDKGDACLSQAHMKEKVKLSACHLPAHVNKNENGYCENKKKRRGGHSPVESTAAAKAMRRPIWRSWINFSEIFTKFTISNVLSTKIEMFLCGETCNESVLQKIVE